MKEKKDSFVEALETRNTSIYYKLYKAKHEIGKVVKNSNNPFFKSKYADLNSILETVEPVLLAFDLIILQPIKDGKVYSQIIDIDTGEMVESWLELPDIVDPQKKLAAITYYRRGTLQSLLCLQAVDDDGNEATKAAKPKLTKDQFYQIVEGLERGNVKYTKEDVLKKYALTKTQIDQL